jgi:hypothetical protein
VVLSLVIGLGVSTWMYFRANQARDAAEQARANEVTLREKAEVGVDIARAAVLLKYGNIQKADELLAKIPPPMAQPSLESAETFRSLGLWHAKAGRWREAADRYAALAYSITSADTSDSDAISRDLLPAVAAMCEARDMTGYGKLRAMAIDRFGGSTNQVVAEQMIKACLIQVPEREIMKKLESLMTVLSATQAKGVPNNTKDPSLLAWRLFSLALMEYRRGDFTAALEWSEKCLNYPNENHTRVALARIVRAMAWYRVGRVEDARREADAVRGILAERFSTDQGIFEKSGSMWQDWLYARMLLREADALFGR